ncbi:MAG: magnesium-dependent phosphatase-1 [Nitrososphaeria archaeon]
MLKLIVLDADRTIWSHHDASSLIPPFKRINDNLIIDKYGSRVELNQGLRDFLEHFINLGIYFSISSWNFPENVFELLELFNILKYFSYPVVEPSPNKGLMIKRIVENFKKANIIIFPEEILYIDDRDIHLYEVKRFVGPVNFLRYGFDVVNWVDAISKVEGLISKT